MALTVSLLLPVKVWKDTSPIWFLGGLVLLVLVLIPGVGIELNGARRWFALQGRVFQPVEFFKFALAVFSARWMAENPKPQTFLFLTLMFSVLLLLQPDLGSLLILLWMGFGLFFLAGGKLSTLGGLGILGVGLLAIVIISSPYRFERLTTYFDPGSDPLGSGFHVRQITLALASGGWFGAGIGNSQQKHAYIPEVSSDSIFAIVAEEIGFLGSLLIILLLIGYLFTLYKMAMSTPERSFSQLLIFGVFLWMSGQILLNLSAVVVLVPLTGLPLPFFSSGGTSLLMTLLATGVAVRSYREQFNKSSSSMRSKVQ
jgi:cell division protein FtsW